MRSDWPEYPLSEVSQNHDALRVPVKRADRQNGPYPYYGASGIVDYVDKYIFDGEYILVAEDGENLRTGKTPIAFRATGKFWVNNHAHIISGNEKSLTRFLEFALLETAFSGFLSGSAMPKLTQASLNRIPISLPPITIQRSISKILGDLDDKIELLRAMTVTLEEIARALFRGWFVDFLPIRAKAAGATNFRGMPQELFDGLPNSFLQSEVGEIPAGWSVQTLADLVSQPIQRGLAPKYLAVGSVAILNQKCIRNWTVNFDFARRHDATAKPPKEREIAPLDILVNSTGVGTLGRVAQIYLVPEPTTFDSHLSLVRPDPEKISPMVLGINLTEREAEIERLGEGSTGQTELSRRKLGGLSILVPPRPLQTEFERLVRAIVARKAANIAEISIIAALRETLLPKLISGELEAPKLEALGLAEAT
jgi:type I restriction enzyme S subunit